MPRASLADARSMTNRVCWSRSLQLSVEFDGEPVIPAKALAPHQLEPPLTAPDQARLLIVAVPPLGPGAAVDEVTQLLEPLQRLGNGFPLTDDDLEPHEFASCTADARRIPEPVATTELAGTSRRQLHQ